MSKKLILVIGATGGQGLAIIDALLAPCNDGSPSPYAVRALTRDPSSRRARELTAKGVECVKGSFDDPNTLRAALKGAYGAWVNTDGGTVGEAGEVYSGMRIFELAKRSPDMRHYIWSSLDYSYKKSGYNPDFEIEHYDGKGRVNDFIQVQPSGAGDNDFAWSIVTSGPYMDMLNMALFGPLNTRADGTVVFASPVGDGYVLMSALEDIGWWARYTFDHRAETSGKNMEIASDLVGWDYLVETFKKVTGKPTIYKRQSIDEWWDNFVATDQPFANERKKGDPSTTTYRSVFTNWWRQWRTGLLKRDMDWIRSVHPDAYTIEKWMRTHNYTGVMRPRTEPGLLKNTEDGKSFGLNMEKVKQL